MINHQQAEPFIRLLYTQASRIAPESFRFWALEQLARVIDFDAAFWGSGNQLDIEFHYVTQLGLDDNYAKVLRETLAINPIKDLVVTNLGKPVNMQDAIADEAFYASELYHQLFAPYGIERILAAGHFDLENGLYSLISLYRFDREAVFTAEEQILQQRLVYHMVSAISHCCFLHLRAGDKLLADGVLGCSAICDSQGCLHQVEPGFVSLLNQHFAERQGMNLPFAIPADEQTIEIKPLSVHFKPLGDLVLVSMRLLGPLDALSKREKQIVSLICKGLSFKEAAKQLNVAPSTVSNHLYRVYEKLGINSRTELAQLVDD